MIAGTFWIYAVIYQFAGGVMPRPDMPACLRKLHPTELCIKRPVRRA